MPKVEKTPFDVKLTQDEEDDLTRFLCDELQNALDARSSIIAPGGQLDYWHWLYRQGKRNPQDLPWPGAANLASPIVPQYVDALRARFLKTVFVEPIWVVEGWGDAAKRAPLVEEFHQWKAEEERLQTWLGRAFDLALIEGTGVLECCERIDKRVSRSTKTLQVQTDELGRVALDAKGRPQPVTQDDGTFLEATDDPSVPTADVTVAETGLIRQGPNYRVISLRDFLLLPGHAIDDSELFGYAKRFWRRVPELVARVEQGIYSKDKVDALGVVSDRDTVTDVQQRDGQNLAPQHDATSEKELWEVLFLSDLDDDGLEEWYVATVSLVHRVLLRVQHDDLGYPRYQLFRPDPDPQSVYGRSFAAKMAPLAEEHAAVRNMKADRAALVTNAPIKRLSTSIWDPQEEPWSPRAIISVHDHNDVQPVTVPDVPQSLMEWEARILEMAERMAGMNDVALGQTPTESRTLGETQLVTEQSFVRQEERIRNLQETMETLFQVRHTLWQRALENGAKANAPEQFVRTLEYRGITLEDGGITAADLQGVFRGKPRGSVETADKARLRGDYNEFLTVVGGLAKMSPAVASVMTSIPVVTELLEQAMRLYNFGDVQAVLGPMKQIAMQQAMMPPGMPMQPGMPPQGPPGMVPGGPPMGPPVMPPPNGQPMAPPNAAVPMDPMLLAQLQMGGTGQPDPRQVS